MMLSAKERLQRSVQLFRVAAVDVIEAVQELGDTAPAPAKKFEALATELAALTLHPDMPGNGAH